MSTVTQDDLGSMLLATVRYSMRGNGYTVEYVGKLLSRHFLNVSAYEQRQIVNEIEMGVALERKPSIEMEDWKKLLEAIRPPKAPFTVDYRCGKCGAEGLKLWRGVHGCKSKEGHELLCAKCLAPDLVVDDQGKAPSDPAKDANGRLIPLQDSDQVAGWLPAVPVDDTFWGYTSVPTADVRWWKALPTYPFKSGRAT